MARKRLNKNLIVALTLSVFVAMVFASVLVLRQLQRGDPRHFIELAQRYQADEQWETAAAFYKRAWERSRDAAFLVPLGDMLLSAGAVGDALRTWDEALIVNPKLIEAHARKLDVLCELAGDYPSSRGWSRVQDAADALLDSSDTIADEPAALAHHAKGLSWLHRVGEDAAFREQGLEALKTAAELAPQLVDYGIDVALQNHQHGHVETGEKWFRRLLDEHQTPSAAAAKVHMAYANHLMNQEQWDEADQHFAQSLSLAENEPDVLLDAALARATFLARRWAKAVLNKTDPAAAEAILLEAESVLKPCIESAPDLFEPYLQLARLYTASGRHEAAVAVCEQRLQRGFSRRGLTANRDQLSMFRLQLSASGACVNHAVSLSAADDRSARDEYLQRAEKYLDDARGEFPSHPRVLHQSARIKLARGQDRPALDDLREADEAYRSSNVIDWENKLLLARLHLRLAEPGAAKAVLEPVVDLSAGRHAVSIRLLYARTLVDNGELDSPRLSGVLAQIFLMDPDNERAKRIRAAVLEQEGKLGQAGRLMEGSPVMVALLDARSRALDGDIDEAIKVLREALKENPADPRLVGAVVPELMNRGRSQEARVVIDRALASAPDDRLIQRIALLLQSGLSREERDQALLDILNTDEDDYQRVWNLIAFYSRKDEPARVLELIKQAEQHLDDADTPAARAAAIGQRRQLLREKMRVAALVDDADALEAARETAITHNVDGAGGKTFLGLYHLYRDEVEQAVKAFREAVVIQPTDVIALGHLAQSLHRLADMEGARTYYERALQVNPRSGVAHKGLAAMAKADGNVDAYERHLTACERAMPNDLWVQQEVLARQEQQDPTGAIDRRRARLKQHPDDVANLMRLAVLSESVSDLAGADDYYQRVLGLRADDRALMVAIAKYYRRSGRPAKALEIVERFAESRDDPEKRAEARVLVAAHHLGVGALDEAERELLAAAELALTFDVCNSLAEFYLRSRQSPRKALTWFERTAEIARQTNSPRLPTILSARIACALSREINDTGLARTFVDELKERFPSDPKGWLWESEVHARNGKLDDAIAALTEYLARRANEPYALFQRAKYHRERGQAPAAIHDLETLERTNPLVFDLEPRLMLARLHFQSKRKGAWVRELEAIVVDAPTDPRVLEALVRAYTFEKRYADADRIATAQINRHADAPAARWFFMRGRISLALNDAARALADFQRGAALDNYSSRSLTEMLQAYLHVGRFEEGVRYYVDHGSGTAKTSGLLSTYARLAAGAGQRKEAVSAFRTALSLSSDETVDVTHRVIVDIQRAFPLDEAVSLFVEDAPAPALRRANDRILVQLYGHSGRLDDALATLAQLVSTASSDRERGVLLLEQGKLYQLADRRELARESYERALEYDHDNWVTLNNIAYILSDELGQSESALPYARRAAELADNSTTLDTLGWVYCGVGDFTSAAAELRRAVRLEPDHALSRYHLGEVYRRNGQFIEAVDSLTAGRQFADEAADTAMAEKIDEALRKANRRETTP